MSLRIVIGENEPDLVAYYCLIATRLGHDVVALATNGWELVTRCAEQRPDLVITEVRLPRIDGLEAMRNIKDHALFIVASAIEELPDDPELRRRIVAHLVKPFQRAQLEDAIAAAAVR